MSENKVKIGEFDWIEQIREQFTPLVPFGFEGIGDDGAVIPIGGGESFVVTTDMLLEDVHFILDKISPEELGYKSLAVNLSDVAAMGAGPIATFLSIGLPKHSKEEWKDKVLTGYKKLSTQYAVPLLGGDTTASEKVVINVTAIGKISNENIKRRSAAKTGDLICVTGELGDSAAGLRLLLKKSSFSAHEKLLVDRHSLPKPYVKEGMWLGAQKEVHAMMDVSDGIASDLLHILEESGVSAKVELSNLPLSESLKTVSEIYAWNAEELASSGGEDYILLLTIDPDHFNELNENYKSQFGQELTVIGSIEKGTPQIFWHRNGLLAEIKWKGFSHF